MPLAPMTLGWIRGFSSASGRPRRQDGVNEGGRGGVGVGLALFAVETRSELDALAAPRPLAGSGSARYPLICAASEMRSRNDARSPDVPQQCGTA